MDFHELANLFPLMNDAELAVLVTDMRENGYDDSAPITTCEGKILDGRNRYRAALAADVTPVYTPLDGQNPLTFVIRHNVNRRHLTESQRAAIAIDVTAMGQGKRTDLATSANLPKLISETEAEELFNVSARTMRTVAAVQREAPDLFEEIKAGKTNANKAQKEVKTRQRNAERAKTAKAGAKVKPDERWHVYHGDVATWRAPHQYDFIITDPPYPKKFLPLYETLAIRANEWLVDGGLLIAMCGQSYLNQIYAMMSKHLTYYWTAAYLTPGQPTPIRQVNVNTTWKPLLIMVKGKYTGKIFGDVFTSDGNDKDFHMWGQSESGMYSIISKMCLAGQSILDPFCGAGTTLVAGLRHGCLADGLEKELENVNITKGRLA